MNDLPMAIEALRRSLALNPAHEVAWIARDGAEAIAFCKRDTPDLVLMDLVMPGMDGVEATRRIMASSPCAILIVTVSVGASAGRVFEAMGHGALDAVDTPVLGGGVDARSGAAMLMAKIDAIGRLMNDRDRDPVRGGRRTIRSGTARADRLLAIGASAGGPAAVATVLGGLPRDFPAAIVIVQHVDERFAPGMADWLNQQSPLPVRLAKDHDVLLPGTVLLAGRNDHIVLKRNGTVAYTPDPIEDVYRPSVDVFFNSVARAWSGEVVGVLLTGMGRDGAQGLKALRNKGCYTIAQDQATSAVYGMPKAAASLDAAVDILPLQSIAARVALAFSRPAET